MDIQIKWQSCKLIYIYIHFADWKIKHVDGIYQKRWGFSVAMLVYRRVHMYTLEVQKKIEWDFPEDYCSRKNVQIIINKSSENIMCLWSLTSRASWLVNFGLPIQNTPFLPGVIISQTQTMHYWMGNLWHLLLVWCSPNMGILNGPYLQRLEIHHFSKT